MKVFFKVLVAIQLCVFLSLISNAQDTTLVRIETKDGNEYLGTIVSENDQTIVLKTETLGEIFIQKMNIKHREVINAKQIVKGQVWFENPQSTRYFWAPNGYGLKKGEGYYQNIYVFWNQFSVGITDNFSLGGGILPLLLLGGGPTPIFITPKVTIPISKDKWNLGAGALIGTVLGEDFGSFGIVYGLSTFGSPDRNLTIGLGYGFFDGEWAERPLINVSGMIRASKRMYFLTENYYINAGGEGGAVLGIGGRWLIKRASIDAIIAIPVGSGFDTTILFPLIGFVLPFGNSK